MPVRGTGFVQRIEADAGLSMFDCPKLAEMESWTNVALSWMIQFLKFHVESSACIAFVIPGARVPSWFNRRSVGDSIAITTEAFTNVQDNNWIGCAFYAAFVAQYVPPSSSLERSIIYGIFQRKNNHCYLKVAEIIELDEITAELTHLFLVFLTRQQVIGLIQCDEDPDGFSFYFVTVGDVRLKVKNWGFRVVCKQDLEE